MALIGRFAKNQDRVTVLLGRVQDITYLSDMALFYTGHWHRRPISSSFTDDLVPAIQDNILATPIALREGEPVIVRRDTETLEGVEKAIYDRLRVDYRLCEVADGGEVVTAHRVTRAAQCPR